MKKLLLFAASLAAFHLQAQDTNPVSETKWYRLTTQFQGEAKSLDVINDGSNDKLTLAKTGNFTGQYWKFTPIGNGWYRLTSQFQGDAKSLDVINDGNNDKLTLAKTGNFTGQYWKLTPVANGYYRLTSQFQGDTKSLDVINDGKNDQLTLARTGNFTGQYWKITELPGVGSGTGSSSKVVATKSPPAPGAPLTIGLGDAVTIEGKLFAQKFATSAEDPKFKGETAFLPIIVIDRKLAFKFSAIDKGFLPGPPPAEPVDRIEITFKDPSLLTMHEKSEGKLARIQGSLIIDQDNRLLPVKFEVSKLEILEPAGKAKPASP